MLKTKANQTAAPGLFSVETPGRKLSTEHVPVEVDSPAVQLSVQMSVVGAVRKGHRLCGQK